jgi:predicted nuclease of predicted toxin-antitoxin system
VKLKLDENVHTDVAPALRALGHDVLTVHDQGLAGHPDADIARAVQQEQRVLVTFDLDFADIRRYPPSRSSGSSCSDSAPPPSRTRSTP